MWTWLTPPAGPPGPPGPASAGCVDFVINSQADLDSIAPAVNNVHTLSGNGVYCFGAVTLNAQRRIVVPATLKVELSGHGTMSIVSGNVDDGAVFSFETNGTDNAAVHAHDMKITNTSTVGAPRAVQSATTELYVHDLAITCPGGEGIRVTAGRTFATNLRITNCLRGVSCQGGEVFLENYDCEALTVGVSIDGTHGGMQWIGGRCGSYTTGLSINANCESIVLQGVTATSGADFVKWNSGTVNRAQVSGNTVSVTTNGIDWAAASIPTIGLSVIGNMFNVSNATSPFVNFTHLTARVNAKANFRVGGTTPPAVPGPMAETPLLFFTAPITPGAIAAGANANTSVTILGARLGDIVAASPRTGFANGICFSFARVSANDTVQVNLVNHSGGSLTPASQTWDFCLFRPF